MNSLPQNPARGGIPARDTSEVVSATAIAGARWPRPSKSEIRMSGDDRPISVTTANAPRFMIA